MTLDEYVYTVYIDNKKFTGYLRIPETILTKFGRQIIAYLELENVSGIEPGTKKVVIRWPKSVFPYVLNASNVIFEIDGRLVFQHNVSTNSETYTTEHAVSIDSEFKCLRVYIGSEEQDTTKTVIGYLNGIREFFTYLFQFPKSIRNNVGVFDTTTFDFEFSKPMKADTRHYFDLYIPTTILFAKPSRADLLLQSIDILTIPFAFLKCYYENELLTDMSTKGSVFVFSYPRDYRIIPLGSVCSFSFPKSFSDLTDLLYIWIVVSSPSSSLSPSTVTPFHVLKSLYLIPEFIWCTAPIYVLSSIHSMGFFDLDSFSLTIPKIYKENLRYASEVHTIVNLFTKSFYEGTKASETNTFTFTVPGSREHMMIFMFFHTVLLDKYLYIAIPLETNLISTLFFKAFKNVIPCESTTISTYTYVRYHEKANVARPYWLNFTRCYEPKFEWVVDFDVPPDLLFFNYVSLNEEFNLDLLLLDPDAKIF